MELTFYNVFLVKMTECNNKMSDSNKRWRWRRRRRRAQNGKKNIQLKLFTFRCSLLWNHFESTFFLLLLFPFTCIKWDIASTDNNDNNHQIETTRKATKKQNNNETKEEEKTKWNLIPFCDMNDVQGFLSLLHCLISVAVRCLHFSTER